MSEGVSGAQRAAILLMTLGEEHAAQIMQHMGPKEVQALGTAMTEVENIDRDGVENILDGFVKTLKGQTSLGIGANDYVRSVLNKALGEDKASGIIDRILLGGDGKGLESLKWMDSRAIAEIIRLEHPQIIAIVLSYLDSDQAAEVLACLPENVRSDIIMRIASLEGIPPAAIRELDKVMESHFSGDSNIKSAAVGGLKTAADILNFVDSSIEAAVMENVRSADEELGDSIADLMFVFGDLKDVDDRAVQTILRDISSDILVTALKGADQTLQDKFLKNMSSRAADMLRDDMETKGPVKVSDVEVAQKEILNVAREKEAAGEIVLGGGGDDFV